MKLRTKSLVFGICLLLFLAWPVAALAYTYVFHIPLKVQNVVPSEVSRASKGIFVTINDANNNIVGSKNVPFQIQQNGDTTVTVEVETTAPGKTYLIEWSASGFDPQKSTIRLQGTLPNQ